MDRSHSSRIWIRAWKQLSNVDRPSSGCGAKSRPKGPFAMRKIFKDDEGCMSKLEVNSQPVSRRTFLTAAACAATVATLPDELLAQQAEPVIDIHQHTHYSGRSDEVLIEHQRKMGISKTVLLPAGSRYGLETDCYGNDSVVALTRRMPGSFAFFANELPDLPNTREVLDKYLTAGAIGIGEQKFPVDCDSPHIHRLAEIANHYHVPVLLHCQHGKYNLGFERFEKVLKKFPRVNFI